MAKIPVQTYNVFGSAAPSTDVEQFGAQEQIGSPNYTTNIATIQALAAWSNGWSAALPSGNRAPYKQDMNAAMLVFSTAISYLYQMGMQEWISTTNYFTNSWVQFGGNIYKSLVDNNLGNQPPAVYTSNSNWKFLPLMTPQLFSHSYLTTPGSGTYTPPAGAIRLSIRMVGAGGGVNSFIYGGSSTIYGFTAAGGQGGTNGTTTGVVYSGGSGGSSSAQSVLRQLSGGKGGDSIVLSASQYSAGMAGPSALSSAQSDNSPYSNPGSGVSGYSSGQSPNVFYSGGGGGETLIWDQINPIASSYTVGASGGGGGGNIPPAGSGAILIDEYYS